MSEMSTMERRGDLSRIDEALVSTPSLSDESDLHDRRALLRVHRAIAAVPRKRVTFTEEVRKCPYEWKPRKTSKYGWYDSRAQNVFQYETLDHRVVPVTHVTDTAYDNGYDECFVFQGKVGFCVTTITKEHEESERQWDSPVRWELSKR